jgi:eukaryotic-like serine/threonine-protein kinase
MSGYSRWRRFVIDAMNRQQQEESLFEAARQLTAPGARRAFLDQACASQPELRASVESLLATEADAEQFFQAGAAVPRALSDHFLEGMTQGDIPVPGPEVIDEDVGTHIGNYKLLQKIGEGGCGIVYMAEQEKPIRRRAALKIIKLGMDTKSVIARFEAERQALAMMDHPNIARVLDAGATETGRPYFVMELVRGIKITDYCDQNHLDVRERLGLFIQICRAIQHAHQKGIIHRDIKPSNVLVTLHDGVPVPKVIDFGIAKAMEVRLTDKTLFTAYEQMIGTPAYMSPEQAEMSGLDVDTRSDIYSLGVLLYELLTGRTPFDPKKLVQGGLEEMRRTLREREPQRPSAMVTTLQGEELTAVTEQHRAELPRLISILRGDLDWIVMKSLEKDRRRRYETANGLAVDIQRYLNNEPVSARPPSRIYRLERLVRRNRVVFLAGAVVLLALVAALAACTVLLVQLKTERDRAIAAEEREMGLRRQAELHAQITQVTLLLSQEKYADADALLDPAASAQSNLEVSASLRSLGEWHALQNEWKPAAERFQQLLNVDQIDGWDVATIDELECGTALIEAGDQREYERFRQAAIARYSGSINPVADRIVKISLLTPADRSLMESLKPLADVALQTFNATNSGEGDAFRAAWQCVSLSLMEYRRGHFSKAIDWSQRCLAFPEANAPRAATCHVILALSWQRLDNHASAKSELALARKLIGGKKDNPLQRGNAQDGFWFDWLFARILFREAEAMIPVT